eukprot:TRINITY_DN4804_c0_g2_i1.p1 TRINITY_DN4804_c0_g2~~TRINITY_DN4804_c0_g2_i1.p1  ORF type:complete len:419 (-),score=53.30 TRINITY_DN4804_c0_g2_i1:860-2116(-)
MGHKGFFGPAKKTTIRAGERLITQILEHDITLDDLKRSDNEEVIHLKRAKGGYWDDASLIDYEDTPSTTRYREQMRKINNWLEQADLEFDEFYEHEDSPVNVTNRRLRRVFIRGSFESGGRLFGGFWLGLSKEQRRNGLLVDGEETVELDFSQMASRIIYGLCKAQLPMDDAYAIPGFAEHRAGIKKVLNSMLFAEAPLKRMPKGMREEFETRHSIAEVTSAIESAHPAIKHVFYTGIGHKAQFIESQLLVDILLTLMEQGITALPIHDAVLIPVSDKEVSRDIMLSIFLRHTGVRGFIKEKGRDSSIQSHLSMYLLSLSGTRKPCRTEPPEIKGATRLSPRPNDRTTCTATAASWDAANRPEPEHRMDWISASAAPMPSTTSAMGARTRDRTRPSSQPHTARPPCCGFQTMKTCRGW